MTLDRIPFVNRYKTIDDEFLQHSEWIRKLRTPSLIGIASILTIPIGTFIITPYVVMNISGPAALLSLLIAFIIMILSGMHLNELMSSMPKSCLLYNFTYANFGEIPAFLVGWISLLDFIIYIIIVAKSWSTHMNLLFHGLFDKHFTIEMPYQLNSIFATKIDFFGVLAIFCASIILCCSIRVLATISIIMITIYALATNSTAFVGFYFADPDNWLAAGFFKNGPTGMLKGASNYLCAYIGIETLSFLLDETQKPRKRLPFIMPYIIIPLTLIMFLTTMIITLVTDITKYPDNMLFPNIFDKLKIPSAKYLMTIGSVCGLSGAMLAIFVPATRILAKLCDDNLLPFNFLAHTSKKRGVPYYAACLVYDQRYNSNVIGLFRETAFYSGIQRKRYKTRSLNNYTDDDQDSCSITASRYSTDDENTEMMGSYEILRSIITKQEAQCQLRVLSEDENLGLLVNDEEMDIKSSERRLMKRPFYVTQYSTFKNSQSLSENLKEATMKLCKDTKQLSLSSFDNYNFGHNCIRSPCSSHINIDASNIRKQNFHIFEHDFPEMPYWSKHPGSVHSPEDFNENNYKRSMKTLLFFILTSITIGFLALKTEINLTKLYLILPMLLAFIALGCLVINATRQTINPVNSERSCKTPIFPYLTLFVIFLTILIICTTDYIIIIGFVFWIIIG
ncbi:unnamed protein product [Onchocerca ochengi]|uniref:AA_permease domain-containing protein n=1 Tax=Onchocerca ochengi TaxID=42157 RepID=A0A182E8I4_ONCOC|nr:unnamed protein product [Onchocerca ochengi]